MNQMVALRNPLMKDLELPIDRPVVQVPDLKLPKGTIVVSADSHWDVATDIFFERLPEEMKGKAPRIWIDGIAKFGIQDEKGNVTDVFTPEILKVAAANMAVPGAYDLDVRRDHLDAEGVQMEINFPNLVLAFTHHPDLEFREAFYRLYNEYMAERSAEMNGRSFGVGILSNWWDADKAESAVQQIKDLGLKTFMIPLEPGKGRDGEPIVYSEPECDRLWAAIAASGLPLCFHIGESSKVAGRGGWAIRVATSIQPFQKPLAQLIFGGVFDRNPSLRVVFAEAGLSWVAPALQDAEMIYDSYPGLHNYIPKLRPSEYWHKHCYATFMNDKLGLEQLKYIGADRIMWGSDYPHAEGTWGYSQGSMQDVIDAVSEDEARMILGGTAIEVFKL